MIDRFQDEPVTDSKSQRIIKDIVTNSHLLAVRNSEFGQFHSFTKPHSMRVAEIGFSRHQSQVFDFSYIDKSGQQKQEAVVIKSLLKEHLYNELAIYNRIDIAGVNFPHLSINFILENGDRSYFATNAEPNLLPVSSLIRADFTEAQDKETVLYNYNYHLRCGVLALLRLHSLGALHQDPTPKNVSIDTKNGRVFSYDFEFSNLTANPTIAVQPEKGLDEIISLIFICSRYATDGFFSFDLRTESEKTLVEQRTNLLKSLNTGPGEFKIIGQRLLQEVKLIYPDIVSSKGWNKDLDRQLVGKLLS